MDVLTKRQADILQAIKEFMAKNGYPPTVREIGSQIRTKFPCYHSISFNTTRTKGIYKKIKCQKQDNRIVSSK